MSEVGRGRRNPVNSPDEMKTMKMTSEISPSRNWSRMFSPTRIGALYVLVMITIVFSIWLPQSFPHIETVKQVLNGGAIIAIASLALLVPMATKTFDLSFAYTMSLAGVVTTHFIAVHDTPPIVAALIGLAAALIVGLVNGFVIVYIGIDSFIATLATGALVQSFITFFTNDNVISSERFAGPFAALAQTNILGVSAPVLYALVIAVALWIFLEHTPTGRRIYAVGFNAEAARLANIRVDRIRFGALIFCSLVAGFGGIVIASLLSAGSPSVGSGYLLPVFAAVFLGSTQFIVGRFNVAGTILAVVLLGTGTVGLSLAGAPAWASNMFNGAVLLLALCAAGIRLRIGSTWLAALTRRARPTRQLINSGEGKNDGV